MTNNLYTTYTALSKHIDPTSERVGHDAARWTHLGFTMAASVDMAMTDLAREAGIISVCLSCGTVMGIDVTGMDEAMSEPLRQATRDAIDWDNVTCACGDDNATTVIF